LTDQITGHEIERHEVAGREITGCEFARQDRYCMKIDYITIEFAILINYKSFFM